MRVIKLCIILSISLLFQSCLTQEFISSTDWNTTIGSHLTKVESAYVDESSIIVKVKARIKNRPWNTTMRLELPLDSVNFSKRYFLFNYKKEIGDHSIEVIEQFFEFKHRRVRSRVRNESNLKKLYFTDEIKDKRIINISEMTYISKSDGNGFIDKILSGEIPNEFLTWYSYTGQKHFSHATIKYYKLEGNKLYLIRYSIELPALVVMPLSAIPNMLLIPFIFLLDLAILIPMTLISFL